MAEHDYRYIVPTLRATTLVASITEPTLRDAPTCYALRDEIISAIDAAGADNLVLDLATVEFIGSIGFLAFLGARRHLVGGKVILCGMSENIREMFRMCRLLTSDSSKQAPFEEAESVDAALARC